MTPRLEACYFAGAGGTDDQADRYERLAKVLEHTARHACPGWEINVERLEPPEYSAASGNPSHVWNTQKLEHWLRRVLEAPAGAQVLLIDGDTVVLRPLDPVWDLEFDVAYTVRERGRLPLNGGVVFLRVSDRTRAFMQSWWDANLRFLGDNVEHTPWRKRYAGINQAALGYVFEKVDHGCAIRQLLCSEWNCVEWDRYDPAVTRIVHVKSGLRRAVFDLPGGAGYRPKLMELVKLWKKLERNTKAEAAAAAESATCA